MKKLKQIADDKHKEFKKIFAAASKDRKMYVANWNKLSLKEKKMSKKNCIKIFKPVWKAEKEYLKAKLNYTNSLKSKK